jgi:hypothetical protein
MPELSYGELMMMCEGHGTSKIYERFLALRSYALSLREKREGLKLVPIEPTETMISHAMTACVAANFSVQNFPFNAKAQERVLLAAAYRAMLSAAPSAGGEER